MNASGSRFVQALLQRAPVDARIDQHRHRARLEQREHQQEELGRRPHHHDGARAADDAARRQARGDGVAAAVELARRSARCRNARCGPGQRIATCSGRSRASRGSVAAMLQRVASARERMALEEGADRRDAAPRACPRARSGSASSNACISAFGHARRKASRQCRSNTKSRRPQPRNAGRSAKPAARGRRRPPAPTRDRPARSGMSCTKRKRRDAVAPGVVGRDVRAAHVGRHAAFDAEVRREPARTR